MKHVRILVAALVAVAALAVASVAVGADDDEKVTLTVGLMQDLDSPNVTAGYLVSSYELWNLQYATLTDKAAADFATEPGLAESYTGSDDGKTWTRQLDGRSLGEITADAAGSCPLTQVRAASAMAKSIAAIATSRKSRGAKVSSVGR